MGAGVLSDPLFLLALIVFLTGWAVFFWCLVQWPGAASPRLRPGTVPGRPAVPASPPQSPIRQLDTSIVAVFEEKFADFAHRIAALEEAREAAPPSADLTPLMRRLDEVEKEITKIKVFLSEIPPPSAKPAQDVTAIAAKVEALQKVIESLVLESEGKPA